MRALSWVVAALGLAGCGGAAAVPEGKLSNVWVVAAGVQPGVGVAAAPTQGSPIAIAGASADGCVPTKTLDDHFGSMCAAHETEGGAATTMTDYVPLGPTPTPGEVRWYCDQHVVVRLVVNRCGTNDSFRVSQLAFAIRR